jgi:hypothetical protein
MSSLEIQTEEIKNWVEKLSAEEKNDLIIKIISDNKGIQAQALIQRCVKETRKRDSSRVASPRTVEELRNAYKNLRHEPF